MEMMDKGIHVSSETENTAPAYQVPLIGVLYILTMMAILIMNVCLLISIKWQKGSAEYLFLKSVAVADILVGE